jgi:hypothetical protein
MRLHREAGCTEVLNVYFCPDMADATNHTKMRRSLDLFLVYHDDERRPAGYGVEQAFRLALTQSEHLLHKKPPLMKEHA